MNSPTNPLVPGNPEFAIANSTMNIANHGITFAIGVLALGVYPKPLTDLMEPAIAQLASQLAATKL